MVCFVVAFVLLGVLLAVRSQAATYVASSEAEAGAVKAPAVMVEDPNASQGKAVRFGVSAPPGGRTVAVSTAAQLKSALSVAKPGDIITMADGTYSGQFVATASGTVTAPITLKGTRSAIIDGGSLSSGYTLHLGTRNSTSKVSYWRLEGFSLTGGQKGIMLDNVQHSVIDNVGVHDIGHEGIHLRNHSSDNAVSNSTVTKTGRSTQAYGEGIYIGSAHSNWGANSQGKPDRSDRNRIINNSISQTAAENVDIKEGTFDGILSGNKLDGTGMCADTSKSCNFADSLVDVKGSRWLVEGNTGSNMRVTWNSGTAENDAMQNHRISQASAEQSGLNNTFRANTITNVAGYGFNIQSNSTGTAVRCDNTVDSGAKGLSNVACTQ